MPDPAIIKVELKLSILLSILLLNFQNISSFEMNLSYFYLQVISKTTWTIWLGKWKNWAN